MMLPIFFYCNVTFVFIDVTIFIKDLGAGWRYCLLPKELHLRIDYIVELEITSELYLEALSKKWI